MIVGSRNLLLPKGVLGREEPALQIVPGIRLVVRTGYDFL